MIATPLRTISLVEHDSLLLAQDEMTREEGEGLWRRYRDHIEVTFPSPVTSGNWRLSAKGWVGHLPVSEEFAVEIKPKVGIHNLFRMLEYAYRLESFRFLDDLFRADTIQDLYERLAGLLSRLVLDRTRRGLYRAYLTRSEHLPYVRGRLEARKLSLRPWIADLPCTYEDHTADIEDNRILSWTLFLIVRSGSLTNRELPNVRRAYRTLQGVVQTYPVGPDSCVGRTYNRLNADYERTCTERTWVLENSGPTHERGDRSMLPFLVNMSRLYELFVSEWLRVHLPPRISLVPQERVYLDDRSGLYFDLDLVLRNTSTDEVLCVLDTKYKDTTTPATDDVAQIVAYAEKLGCQEAILVYPRHLSEPLDIWIGQIRVRTLGFPVNDVDHKGEQFMDSVLDDVLGHT